MQPRTFYALASAIVLIAGIASRVFHSGVVVIDKYLGDALYAMLAYLLLSLVWPDVSPGRKAMITLALMLAVETFQLTLIPDRFAQSGNILLRLLALALGTRFSWRDLLAYAIGICGFYLLDRYGYRRRNERDTCAPN